MNTDHIPFVKDGFLRCSCGTPTPFTAPLAACPCCGRPLAEVHAEAARNADIMLFVQSKPLEWGCPELHETSVQWWARMAAAYEAHLAEAWA